MFDASPQMMYAPIEKGGDPCMIGTLTENKWRKGSKYVVRFKPTFKRFANLDADRVLRDLAL